MKPHREFWIYSDKEKPFLHVGTHTESGGIRVIEYKAYIEALAQAEKLAAALEKIGMPYEDGPGMFIARQLEDRQALAKEALENFRSGRKQSDI